MPEKHAKRRLKAYERNMAKLIKKPHTDMATRQLSLKGASIRKCLGCSVSFTSLGPHNRMCPICKNKS